MSRNFRVKNWEKFQHYRDRAPPWIRLYNELLDDYEFGRLPDASKIHLVAIWLLASRSNNVIPYDSAWIAQRINATSPVDLELLEESGFIEPIEPRSKTLAPRKQNACPETEQSRAEGEKKEEGAARPPSGKQNLYTDEFAALWRAYPRNQGSKYEAARSFAKALAIDGVTADRVIAAAKRYAEASARPNAPFVAHAATWLNQRRWEVFEPTPPTPDDPARDVAAKQYLDAIKAWERDDKRGPAPKLQDFQQQARA